METDGAYQLDVQDSYDAEGHLTLTVSVYSSKNTEQVEELSHVLEAVTDGIKDGGEYLVEKSTEALEIAEKTLTPLRKDFEYIENVPAFKLLKPVAIKFSLALNGLELISGVPPGEVASEYVVGWSSAVWGAALATVLVAFIPETVPVFVGGAVTAFIVGLSAYAGNALGKLLYDEVLEPTIATAADVIKNIGNELSSALSGQLENAIVTGFSSTAGQAALKSYISNLEAEFLAVIQNALSNYGVEASPDQISALSSGLAALGTLYYNAAVTSAALPAAQQTTSFNTLVANGSMSLTTDVTDAVEVANAALNNQQQSLAGGGSIAALGSGGFSIDEPITNSAFGAVSTTSNYDGYGNITGSDTEYSDGSSEIISEDPTTGNVIANWYSGAQGSGSLIAKTVEVGDVATTTSFDASGNKTGIDVENFDNSTSTQTVISPSTHLEAITAYSELGDQGTGTLLAFNYLVQPGDTFASVAAALGLGVNGGGALAAINGQTDAGAVINQPQIYVPTGVGATQSLAFDSNATVSEVGTGYQMTTETWTFSSGGILTLSGGVADGGSFTPLTMGGTQDPVNAVYIFNAAGVLIDILPDATSTTITETIQNYPATIQNSKSVPPSLTISYDVTSGLGGIGQYGNYFDTHAINVKNNFGLANSDYGLPFFAEDGGTTTTATADLGPSSDRSAVTATFNAFDDLPDASWGIGVNAAGDAVFTGLSGSGYNGVATLTQGENGTALVDGVTLGQSFYGLTVIPNSGVAGTLGGNDDSPSQNIVAEGTGTTNITINNDGTTNYWHVNGYNDSFTLSGATTEFYIAGSSSAYQLGWDGNGTFTINGGSTGTTAFHIGSGSGNINFSNGVTIALNPFSDSGIESNLIFGGSITANYFLLNGGDQAVYGAGTSNNNVVSFNGGSDDPADWGIMETAVSGQPITVTFDGTNAGYDGVATLSNIQLVTLNDITYQLTAVAPGGTQTIANGPSIVVDLGSATLTFNDVQTSDWFVGGQNDVATLLAGTTEIFLNGAGSSYTLSYSSQNQLKVTGGTTGTTTINLDGGAGEINFGDGSVVGIGGIEDDVEYAGSGAAVLNVDAGGIAYGGSGTDTFYPGEDTTIVDGSSLNFIDMAGSESDYTVSKDSNGDVTLVDDVPDRSGTTVVDAGLGQGTILFASGGSVDVSSIACFVAGTLIAVPHGDMPVEALAIGDLVLTISGLARPIKWIGTRSYDQRFVANNEDIQPIRIQQGALAEGLPHRDLLVSPLHAMFLNGVLVPAKQLINDVTITQVYNIDTIHYFHVELNTHDIILANGAPTETFVDCDSRGMFQNEADYHARYPNDRGMRWAFCAPRIEDGHHLEEIKRQLAVRAGMVPDGASSQAGPLRGYFDTASHEGVTGWAWQPEHPDSSVRLDIVVDGGIVAQVVANRERSDVRRVGFGDGRCGFEFKFPTPLSPFRSHVIEVRRQADGTGLEYSPRTLEAAPILDSLSRAALAKAIKAHAAHAVDPDDLESLARLLVTGKDQLLRSQVGRRSLVQSKAGRGRKAQNIYQADNRPLALVIDDRLPTPDQDAGSNAILDHMQSLIRLGYQVAFAPRDMSIKGGYARALKRLGILCFGTPYYGSVEEVLRRHDTAISLVYLHRITTASLYGELIRELCPKVRIIYSVADLHFLRLGRQAALEGRPALSGQSRQLQVKEIAAARLADAVITHSAFEAATLRKLLPGLNVHTVPWSFATRPPRISFAKRTGLAFIGNYDHQPNVDAVAFLVQQVMPRVWEQDASIECILIGSNMPDALSRLIGGRITALGQVPDLDSIFNRVRLTVAPLRVGAGLKGKVLQSLAAGVPCVCTPIAAEGMAWSSALTGLVGRSVDELAASIVRLHQDEAENAALAEAGLGFIASHFTLQQVDGLLDVVLKIMPDRASRSTARRSDTPHRGYTVRSVAHQAEELGGRLAG